VVIGDASRSHPDAAPLSKRGGGVVRTIRRGGSLTTPHHGEGSSLPLHHSPASRTILLLLAATIVTSIAGEGLLLRVPTMGQSDERAHRRGSATTAPLHRITQSPGHFETPLRRRRITIRIGGTTGTSTEATSHGRRGGARTAAGMKRVSTGLGSLRSRGRGSE
jgi:hypothetical protein